MTSSRYGLDNLCLIIDYNGLQVDGFVKDVMPLEPLAAKWEAFNWKAIEIDGHDLDAIQAAFKSAREGSGRPTAIVAKTVKGKGVSYMEDECGFHAACLSEEQTDKALEDIRECRES